MQLYLLLKYLGFLFEFVVFVNFIENKYYSKHYLIVQCKPNNIFIEINLKL